MNDPKRAMKFLGDAISELRPDLDPMQKAGLYGGLTAILNDLDKWVEDYANADGYSFEKIGQIRWHVAAALGLDIDNDHAADQHRVFACGALSSLERQLSRIPTQE